MRTAISPRLAMSIFLNMLGNSPGARLLDDEERLAEFDRICVLDQDFSDAPSAVGGDLVHGLHGFDDAQSLAGLDGITYFYKGLAIGRGGIVEGADHGGF